MKFCCSLILSIALCVGAFAQSPGADRSPFDVRKFGALGDGKNLDSPAIDRAIDAAAKAGGGTVWISAGTYLCGSVHLQSNIHLYLDAGAVILAAPQAMNAYDETEPWDEIAYEDGGHVYFHNSLIWGENLTNVSITGPGRIDGRRDGQGLVSNDKILDDMCGYNIWNHPGASLPKMGPVRLGNKAIALKLCRGVLIRDVTFFDGGHFAILVTGCDNVTLDNLTIDTNRDGVDIDCCRNTVVSNCRINSPDDDGLCIKSTYALKRPVITENLAITNCEVSGFADGTLLDGSMKPSVNKMGRIKFGTESSGGYRNCTVSNCTFRACRGLALEEVDGGIMENITISNLAMMDIADYAIYMTTGKRNRTPDLKTPSRMRNITISNVVGTGIAKMSGIQVTGLSEQPIENVRFDNIRLVFNGRGSQADAQRSVPELGTGYPEPGKIGVLAAYGLFARHVRGLEMANIHFSFKEDDQRPPLWFEDVDGLDIFNFKAQVAEGVPAAKLNAVRNMTVTNSPVLHEVTQMSP